MYQERDVFWKDVKFKAVSEKEYLVKKLRILEVILLKMTFEGFSKEMERRVIP